MRRYESRIPASRAETSCLKKAKKKQKLRKQRQTKATATPHSDASRSAGGCVCVWRERVTMAPGREALTGRASYGAVWVTRLPCLSNAARALMQDPRQRAEAIRRQPGEAKHVALARIPSLRVRCGVWWVHYHQRSWLHAPHSLSAYRLKTRTIRGVVHWLLTLPTVCNCESFSANPSVATITMHMHAKANRGSIFAQGPRPGMLSSWAPSETESVHNSSECVSLTALPRGPNMQTESRNQHPRAPHRTMTAEASLIGPFNTIHSSFHRAGTGPGARGRCGYSVGVP